MTTLGQVLALIGATLTLIAAIGVHRFPDVLSRMHALTKAASLGFAFLAVGAAVALPTANDATSALLAIGLQLLTLPVAANLISRSTYLAEGIPQQVDLIDELARDRALAPDPERPEADQPAGEG